MYLLHITSPTIIPVIVSTCCSRCRMEQLLPLFLHSHYLWQVLVLQYLLEYLEVYFQYHNPKAILTGISSVVPSTSRSLFFSHQLWSFICFWTVLPLCSFCCFCPTSCTTISLFQLLSISPVFHHPVPTSGTWRVRKLFSQAHLSLPLSISAILPDSDIQITTFYYIQALFCTWTCLIPPVFPLQNLTSCLHPLNEELSSPELSLCCLQSPASCLSCTTFQVLLPYPCCSSASCYFCGFSVRFHPFHVDSVYPWTSTFYFFIFFSLTCSY